MIITPDSPIYRKAFEKYLRKGTSLDISIKAALTEHPTPQYIWRTQGDDKVRSSHAANEGQVFSWDNPPTATGNPGDQPGCRCWGDSYYGPDSLNKPGAGSTVTTSGRDVIIHHPDGSIEIRHGGTPAWRHNNPSNIKPGPFADRHGSIGSAGGFAVFPNASIGQEASKALLKGPSYSNLTIDDAVAKRSPPKENDTKKVQENVREISGFSGKEVIGTLSDEEVGRLANAIKRAEGWKEGTITVTRESQ